MLCSRLWDSLVKADYGDCKVGMFIWLDALKPGSNRTQITTKEFLLDGHLRWAYGMSLGSS